MSDYLQNGFRYRFDHAACVYRKAGTCTEAEEESYRQSCYRRPLDVTQYIPTPAEQVKALADKQRRQLEILLGSYR